MSDEKLQAQKRAIEEALLENNNEREQVIETVLKPAQKSLTELQAAHTKLDGKYEAVCELLELDVSKEFDKFLQEKAKEFEAKAKEAPTKK